MRHDSSKAILSSVNQLVSAVTALVSAVGTAAAGAAHGAARSLRTASADASHEIAERSDRLKKAIKAHWDAMTPSE